VGTTWFKEVAAKNLAEIGASKISIYESFGMGKV
jgi:hypothetical protein